MTMFVDALKILLLRKTMLLLVLYMYYSTTICIDLISININSVKTKNNVTYSSTYRRGFNMCEHYRVFNYNLQ